MSGRGAMAGRAAATGIPLLLVLASISVASCRRDAAGAPVAAGTAAAAIVVDSLGAVARAIAAHPPYEVVTVRDPGTIRGVVSMDSTRPRRDITLSDTDDTAACGRVVHDGSIETDGHGLGNALVWVSNVRRGLAPPVTRRAALAIIRCQYSPRVLALVAGTTIDFASRDDAVHHTRFVNALDGKLLTRMLTVDRWEVVPSARIAARPGLVQVEGVRHSFARGYVAVFANPYFAVTDRRGRFAIRGLPVGTYHVRVWHERAPVVLDRVVTVAAGRTATLDVTLTGGE